MLLVGLIGAAVPCVALGMLLFGTRHEQRSNPVIDIRCGPTRLRFEERVKPRNFYGLTYRQVLTVAGARDEGVLIDEGPHEGAVYSGRMYSPDEGFLLFGPFEGRGIERSTYHSNAWDIFVHPERFSMPDYGAIAACIQKNIPAIDAAYDRPRGTEPPPDEDRRVRLTSILRADWDPGFSGCGKKVTGRRFDCEDRRVYLKSVPPRNILMCRTDVEYFDGYRNDIIGRISEDQGQLEIRGPGFGGTESGEPYSGENSGVKALVGPDWENLYRNCRDASGKSLFDYFAVKPWQGGLEGE